MEALPPSNLVLAGVNIMPTIPFMSSNIVMMGINQVKIIHFDLIDEKPTVMRQFKSCSLEYIKDNFWLLESGSLSDYIILRISEDRNFTLSVRPSVSYNESEELQKLVLQNVEYIKGNARPNNIDVSSIAVNLDVINIRVNIIKKLLGYT